MNRLMIAFAIAGLTTAASEANASEAARARPPIVVHRTHRVAWPVDVALDPWGAVELRTPFTAVDTPDGPTLVRMPHYQAPDGTYDSQADLVDAINGVPCGDECTARALTRWGYNP